MLQAFRAIDKKKTGTIPTKSLRTILESMGHSISSSEFYMITADADVESSGTLDFQEYMSVRLRVERSAPFLGHSSPLICGPSRIVHCALAIQCGAVSG